MSRRIGFLIDNLAGGGAEKKVLIIAAEMTRIGHEAHVIQMADRVEYPIPAGVRVHSVHPAGTRRYDMFWNVGETARKLEALVADLEKTRGRFDLFLANLDKTTKVAARTRLRPVFYVVRNAVAEELRRAVRLGPIQYFRVLAGKRALQGKDLVAVSEGLADELRGSPWIRPRTVRTILNPYDLDEIRRMSLETVEGVPDGPYLIHVGRFARQKRHDVLFRAMKRVDPALRLVLLCRQREKALRSAAAHGVSDRVVVPGFQVNPYPWIRRARLLVLSSDFEGFVNVLVEALACGTPVVSTRCPHSPEEILTGPLARWLVPRRDPEALAARIAEALGAEIDVRAAPILARVSAREITQEYLSLVPGE